MRCRPLSLFAIAVVGCALTVACGSGDDEGEQAESAQATAQRQDGAEAGAEEEAAARAVESVSDAGVVEADDLDGTPLPQAQEPPEPLEVFEEIDFDSILGGGLQIVPLGNLESYRYTLAITATIADPTFPGLIEVRINSEGESVGDRLHATCTGSLLGLAIDEEVIIVGDQAWIRSGLNGGGFTEGRPQFCTPDLTPAGLGADLAADELELLYEGTSETVNGVDTTRYTLDEAALAQLGGIGDALVDFDPGDFPEDLEFRFDIWLAEDGGWPVKIEGTVEGSDTEGGAVRAAVSLEVFDVNSDDIRIEVP